MTAAGQLSSVDTQERASGLLTKFRSKLAKFGFSMDEATTEVALIFTSSSIRDPPKKRLLARNNGGNVSRRGLP
jgi:hypothetical protein